jgi:hypothetical protein
MENKVPQGSLLVHNISHGVMSNVQTSLYLWDLSQCLNKPTKNLIANWTIDVLVSKTHQILKCKFTILLTMRCLETDLSNLVVPLLKKQGLQVNENDSLGISRALSSLKVGVRVDEKEYQVIKIGDVVIIDGRPLVMDSQSESVYD